VGGKIHKKKKKGGVEAKAPAVPPSGPIDALAARRCYVFDRHRTNHPWESALRAAIGSHPTQSSIQENWRMDPRVSEARESAFSGSIGMTGVPVDFGEWSTAVEGYYKREAWRAFGEPTNFDNEIDRSKLPPHNELLHVVSLGRLFGFLNRRPEGPLAFAFDVANAFPSLSQQVPAGNPEDPSYGDRVWSWAQQVNGRGQAEVQRLAGFLADRLGDLEPPWWAGFAAELEPALNRGGWVELCRLLGMGHLIEGETLLVFRYPVERIFETGRKPLRPTSIEAAMNPCHFPSPRSANFGYTMPLTEAARRYCREMIHAPLKGDLAASSCVFPLVRLAEPALPTYDLLPSLRHKQRERLARELPGADVRAWLGRHPAI
jgi:hypothetical protein